MLTFRNIDWNRAWSADRGIRSKGNDQEFWNRRAPSFSQHVEGDDGDDYVDPFLEIMDPQPEWSLLDVGCGPGTLACPLAKIVRRVTAIDFSPVMLDILRNRKQSAGIENITEREARWEDDWQALGIERHDVAVASRSIASDDPQALLTKLMAFAGQRVYISCAVGDGPFDREIFEAVGRKRDANPDYIYIYNLLYQMGFNANVRLIEKKIRTYAGEDEAIDSVRWMLENMTAAEEDVLRRFISAHLVADGRRWRLDFQRSVSWAVIWWKVAAKP